MEKQEKEGNEIIADTENSKFSDTPIIKDNDEIIADTKNSKFSDTSVIKDNDEIIADLHIHSRFSMACSKNLDLPNIVKWARIKGVNLLGTSDFTHPVWLNELKENLKEENGIYWYEDEKGKFPFILSSEISLVYTQNEKGRRVHLLYLAPNFEAVDKINAYLDTKGRRDYDGRPIFKISCEDFVKEMKKIDSEIEVIPAHIWTPYFGVFGSKGGFDSLDEAFGSQVENIHAIETGISSDPEMNIQIKELVDKNISIVSFSDSHSYWPWRFAREATIFTGDITYTNILNQIRTNTFKSTIETDPAYGRYHWDGHSKCDFSCSPSQTKELDGKCPKCGKPLTIGVEYRVEELSKIGKEDEKENTSIFAVTPPPKTKKFYRLLPLHELIAFYLGVKNVNGKGVWNIYNKLIEKFGDEYNLLLRVDKNILANELVDHEELFNLIVDNRIANIKIDPGYDGEYGRIVAKDKQDKLF